MARQEVIFEEAQARDAQALIDFMNQVAVETDFLVLEARGFSYTVGQVSEILVASEEAANQLCLLAKVGEMIIGVINVKAPQAAPIAHIGDIFMAVRKDYWGYGIGRILLEEVIDWAREMGTLKRLEMTVQIRNERAVKLYQSCGFDIEGIQKRGCRTDEGEWLDLYYMGRLID
ncbi:MAG: GNAT family N-acetyltransferase [Streptococcus hyovaginalis]|nr:GNAT family N-acetyltransferase [Streptococcus hyovaginalis]